MPFCLSCGKTKTKLHFYLKCFLFYFGCVFFFGYAIIKTAYKVIEVRAKKKERGPPRAKKFPSMTHTSLTERQALSRLLIRKMKIPSGFPSTGVPIQSLQVSLTAFLPRYNNLCLFPNISDSFSSRPPHTPLCQRNVPQISIQLSSHN